MLTLFNLKDSYLDRKTCVSKSEMSSDRNAIDITIKQTINKQAKTSGDIISFSRNYSAYMCLHLTRNSRLKLHWI